MSMSRIEFMPYVNLWLHSLLIDKTDKDRELSSGDKIICGMLGLDVDYVQDCLNRMPMSQLDREPAEFLNPVGNYLRARTRPPQRVRKEAKQMPETEDTAMAKTDQVVARIKMAAGCV